MEAKDLINLVNAGFSKDDILKMFPETPQAQTSQAQTPPANDPNTETIKNLTTQVTTLTEIIKTMQSDAIKNAGGGKPETKTSLDVVKDFFGQTTK